MTVMKVENEINWDVLEDGAVSVDTGEFSEEVHMQAEEFIDAVFEDLGGERKVVKHKPHDHKHGHTHVHQTVRA